jgi:hypothetical protein
MSARSLRCRSFKLSDLRRLNRELAGVFGKSVGRAGVQACGVSGLFRVAGVSERAGGMYIARELTNGVVCEMVLDR